MNHLEALAEHNPEAHKTALTMLRFLRDNLMNTSPDSVNALIMAAIAIGIEDRIGRMPKVPQLGNVS